MRMITIMYRCIYHIRTDSRLFPPFVIIILPGKRVGGGGGGVGVTARECAKPCLPSYGHAHTVAYMYKQDQQRVYMYM